MRIKLLSNSKVEQKGFTLIELLVVVAILGVLAAVAIPNVGKFIGSGKTEAANTELVNVQTAVTAYMSKFAYGWATDTGREDGTVITVDTLKDEGILVPSVAGTYSIQKDGTVNQDSYPY